jgi:hypothetical protein
MNVEIGTEAAQFPSWEYFFPIFGTVSLKCVKQLSLNHLCKREFIRKIRLNPTFST